MLPFLLPWNRFKMDATASSVPSKALVGSCGIEGLGSLGICACLNPETKLGDGVLGVCELKLLLIVELCGEFAKDGEGFTFIGDLCAVLD
jgi:hypothetical protein